MSKKTVKIPVSDIDGLQQNGYLFRYRVVSKDGNRKSDWSSLLNLPFPISKTSSTEGNPYMSLYQRNGDGSPTLSDLSFLNPHPTNAYTIDPVYVLINNPVNVSIKSAGDGSGKYTAMWHGAETIFPHINPTFDVYISWKNTSAQWTSWQYSGTVKGNSFSFTKPDTFSAYTYVQVAVYLSSYPKLTDIYKQETNFVGISSAYTTYQDDGTTATVPAWTSNGLTGANLVYTTTITGLTQIFPSATPSQYLGRKVFGTVGASTLLENYNVTIKSRVSNTSVVLEAKSTSAPPTGTLTNFRLD